MKRRDHPLYSLWKAMRNRCNSPNNPAYANYGGRGIKVCDRWNDFWLFVEDMGERPDGSSLDRIDNDGDYTPDNCRWATRISQQTNRRAGSYIRTTDYGFRVSITIKPYTKHERQFSTYELAEDYLADTLYERAIYRRLCCI